MSNPQRKPASNLLLKLHWPPETDAPSGTQHVVVELQDSAGLAVASVSVLKEQLLSAIQLALATQLRFDRKFHFSKKIFSFRRGCRH